MKKRIASLPKKTQRTGALSVEAALCIPILFLLFFAQFEFSRVNSMRHSIHDATYEAARRGIPAGATVADIQARATQLLNATSVKNATVTVTPGTITQTTP